MNLLFISGFFGPFDKTYHRENSKLKQKTQGFSKIKKRTKTLTQITGKIRKIQFVMAKFNWQKNIEVAIAKVAFFSGKIGKYVHCKPNN